MRASTEGILVLGRHELAPEHETAKALGLDIPPALLSVADELIE
jgi:hypothetical protein